MKQIVVATKNAGKVREFARLLGPMGYEVKTAAECGFTDEVEETGTTFMENSRLKAEAVCKALGLPALADDSGLCVDALGGAPGIYSARFGGEELPYGGKIALLLEKLGDLPCEQRGAHFACAICCVFPDGSEVSCEEHCAGTIGFAPSGEGGFGYDPVFYVDNKSFGEMTAAEKDAVSHRGKALRRFCGMMAQQEK